MKEGNLEREFRLEVIERQKEGSITVRDLKEIKNSTNEITTEDILNIWYKYYKQNNKTKNQVKNRVIQMIIISYLIFVGILLFIPDIDIKLHHWVYYDVLGNEKIVIKNRELL